ncbi:MAG: hypothetical protein R3C44_20510 [Chloroflexota bacterium]
MRLIWPPLGSDFPTYLDLAMSQGQTNIAAWEDDGQYMVVITTRKDEPVPNVVGELIQNTRVTYQFDRETGAIRLYEVTDQTTDGEWIIRERSLLLIRYHR